MLSLEVCGELLLWIDAEDVVAALRPWTPFRETPEVLEAVGRRFPYLDEVPRPVSLCPPCPVMDVRVRGV